MAPRLTLMFCVLTATAVSKACRKIYNTTPVVVTLVSAPYAPLLPIWMNRLEAVNISNYCIAVLDTEAELASRRIANAHTMIFFDNDIADGDPPTRVRNRDPYWKMQIRKKASLINKMLRNGYDVLYTDIDVVFMKNPFPLMQNDTLAAVHGRRMNRVNYNTGFLYFKNTFLSKQLVMRWLAAQKHIVDDQVALNTVLMHFSEAKNAFTALSPTVCVLRHQCKNTAARCRDSSTVHFVDNPLLTVRLKYDAILAFLNSH